MSHSTAEPFAGSPRQPTSIPLERADELGIRQVLDADGRPTGNTADPELERDDVVQMYETMCLVKAMDERGWQLQRSGRVEFWIPSRGQEAAHVASTMALRPEDWIFLADREPGSFLLRGADLAQMFAQYFGREGEPLKGRRLPLLLGDRALNIVPCTTQVGSYIPHAAGAAWAAKLSGDDTRVMVYFGDGATSRGEFHSAMNFAGIHRPPVVFFCQNNGWAVSTPNDRQTATETFAEKGAAYGVRSIRVDGNDPLAVYAATREAWELAPEVGATFIEAVTYRIGFHTSSDNPALYRMDDEVAAWLRWDPIDRTRNYLRHREWWTDEDEEKLLASHNERLSQAIRVAESMPKPGPGSQFDDLYAEEPWTLAEQRDQLFTDLGEMRA